MSYLILVRHGQSVWNLEKKFTGWVDVDLTENGKSEATKAGELIKMKNINIDIYYSSFQLRAKNTLKLIKQELQDKKVSKEAWQLNERHYGALTGLNKDEMKVKLGEEKVHQFRRSWDLRPDPLDKNNPYHPINIDVFKKIPINRIPDTESLKDTYERVLEFYKQEIENKVSKEAWQLNERHYGALTGLNKDEMKIKLGEEKVHQFRRSWDLRPDPLDKNNPYHPINIDVYKEIPINKIPDTESLKDTYERVLGFYKQEIENEIVNNNILISAHGNSIRALCKYLFKLDENQISKLEIPTGNPLLINLDKENKIEDCKYLDKERAKDLLVF